MRNGVSRIGRIDLRIERGDFHREIYDGKKLRIFSERVGPTLGFSDEALQQIEATRRIFIGLFFTEDSLAQKIDSEPDFLCVPLAQRFHHICAIFSGDKLPRHSGNVASQDECADPRHEACDAHTALNRWREAVVHTGEIFFEMLDDITRFAKRRQNIYKAKHLHFELLIAHRERHHPLIKTGLAEKRLWMLIDQLKNARTAL